MAKSVYKPRPCPICGREEVRVTNAGTLYGHTDLSTGNPCEGRGLPVPSADLTLPPTAPDPLGAFLSTEDPECPTTPTATAETPPSTPPPLALSAAPEVNSSPSSPGSSPSEPESLSPSPSTPGPSTSSPTMELKVPDAMTAAGAIPGVEEYVKNLAAVQYAAYKGASVDGRPSLAQSLPKQSGYSQPGPAEAPSPYAQPAKVNPVIQEALPMGDLAKQITVMLKEIFYQHTNRMKRSVQETLGPSQIGTPCDRRIAMHLLGMAPVNPGGDNWASFKGTWVHAGLAEMFDWADAGKGRFVTEMKVKFPNAVVPHGTADLLDRVLFMIDDHKVMSQWSLDKLKRQGPSLTYQIQLHAYAFGARLRGEKIEYVALIGWPADKTNLDDLYVWVTKYDPDIARKALARAEQIKSQVEERSRPLEPDGEWSAPAKFEVAQTFPIVDDCRFCGYYQKGAKDLSNGACNGRI